MMKKHFAVVLFASALLGAQTFTTGQAARAVFGQQTFTAQDQDSQTGVVCGPQVCTPTPYILGAAGGVAYANNMLFVADSNYVSAIPLFNRVLIYTNVAAMLPGPTDEVNPPNVTNFVRCPLCLGTSLVNYYTLVLGGYPPNAAQTPDYTDYGINAQSFRTPTAVATNGTILAVADTDNNRILIWNSIPTTSGQAADIVLGQKDFNSVGLPVVDNKSFRGPQGVWIQGNRFFVADTQNNRVMIWNSIPTSNDQPADLVLGAPNFTTVPQPDLTKANLNADANTLASPVSVTSDGTRLYVTDLGNNRVLIWNTIPTQNQQAADLVIGQPDMKSNSDNNSFTGTAATSSTDTTHKEAAVLCPAVGTDPANNPTFPQRCAATLSFPRFALSDGKRLFIADGGNDRILVFNNLPGQNGQRADAILGQPDEYSDNATDSTDTFRPDANITRSSADTVRTPLSLAWDGTNLYATDAFDRRVMVFTPGQYTVPENGIVNAASQIVNAISTVAVTGTITAGDQATISIGANSGATPTNYTYTVTKTDTLDTITTALVKLINAGPDPNVIAVPDIPTDTVVLTSRIAGANGNGTTVAVSTVGAGSSSSTTNAATVVLTSSSSTLQGGASAAEIAPGSLVTLFAFPGSSLSDNTAAADPNAKSWPTSLGGVQVYFNGLKAPLSYVSPTQINAQMPFEMLDTSSVSAYVRTVHNDGTITNTAAIGVPIVTENPGIFAYAGNEPRQAIAYHASSNAIAVIDLEGSAQSGDTAVVTIDSTSYSYAVQSTDTLDSIRDALIALINADANARVTATAAGQYDRIIVTAKVAGTNGNGIPITVSQSSTVSAGAKIALTALQPQTCCASVAGTPVTSDNPAIPGETIDIYATGLGVIQPDAAKNAATTGSVYQGPAQNQPNAPVDNAQVGGKTANVLYARLMPGMVGVYQVVLQLDPGLTTSDKTQMYIAQDVFTSNIVTIPVVAPPPSQ